MSAGSIVIDLLMRTGSFTTDTQRSAKDLEKLKKEALATGRALGDAFKSLAAAVGITATAAGLAALTQSAIDAADELDDLAQKTGIAVESLSALAYVANVEGVAVEALSGSLAKLARSMSDAARGSKEQAGAFAALGVAVQNSDGSLRSTDAVLRDIAQRFAGYEDSAEKAALAQAIFGKSGADLIPLLNYGAEGLDRMTQEAQRLGLVISTETAAAAAEFNDTLTKIRTVSQQVGLSLAGELLPPLQAIADEFLKGRQEGGGFSEMLAGGLRNTLQAVAVLASDFVFVIKGIGRELGALAAQAVELPSALLKRDFTGFRAISDAVKDDGVRARAELDAFQRRVLGINEQTSGSFRPSQNYGEGSQPGKVSAPRLAGTGSDAELRKRLDGEIKAIREFADQQRDAYEFAQGYVDAVMSEGAINLQAAFAEQRRIREDALQATIAGFNQEIAALQAYRAKVTGAERIDAENKIAEVTAKRAEAMTRAAQDSVIAAQREAVELKRLGEAYDDLRARVLELTGDDRGAAAIRNSRAAEDARRLITQQGGDPALADRYAELLNQTAELNQVQREYNELLERARLAEEDLLLIQQTGGASELDTMREIGAVRQRALSDMAALVNKARELAAALGTPEAALFADNLAAAMRRATAEVDPLLVRVREVGREAADTIASGFAGAITQGKGLRSTIAGIGRDLEAILTRQFITKPLADFLSGAFTGGGGGSGLGGLFGSLLGAFAGSGGAVNLGTATGADLSLFYAANGAAFNGAGRVTAFASGGVVTGPTPFTYSGGKRGVMGEAGSEAILPLKRGTDGKLGVAAAGNAGMTVSVTNNFTLQGQVDRRTQAQIAADVGRSVQIAMRRNA